MTEPLPMGRRIYVENDRGRCHLSPDDPGTGALRRKRVVSQEAASWLVGRHVRSGERVSITVIGERKDAT